MSEEGQTSSFGSYIHNSIPEGFHVNPYQCEVKPCMQLQNSSFSFQDYRRNAERGNNDEQEQEQEEDGYNQNDHPELQNAVIEEQPTNLNEDIVEVDDTVEEEDLNPNTPVHNALNSFGSFIFDIYQSSSYYIPTNHSRIRTRFQYMNEYYRRMIQLIESSTKQEAASEETIKNLCVNIFFSVDWCPICLEDYMENMVTTVLPCGHRFHLCCLKSWLHINHKCPVCKIVV